MSSCSIKWCGKNSKTSNSNTDGISFHRFPKDPDVKDAWITATKRDSWFPRPFSVICSRHFTSDCFDQIKNRRRLFSSAVPTLLLPQLGTTEDTTPSDTEEAFTSMNRESADDHSPVKAKDESKNTETSKKFMTTKDSTSKKILSRKITDLTMSLKKSKLTVKRLQESNSYLKRKYNTLKSFLVKLKDKELFTQEKVNIHRLQHSNQQLRKKVIWLKRLLIEQKKKNLASQHNVVWCPAVDETLELAKKE